MFCSCPNLFITAVIVINKNVNPINYCITYFDIDYCKVIIDGLGNAYFVRPHDITSPTKISDHILNVFELFKKNVEFYKSSNSDLSSKYYTTLLNSMKFYVKKVKTRINKYSERGVLFDPDNQITFTNQIDTILKYIVIVSTSNFVESVVEPVVEPVAEPVVESVAEPVVESVVEPTVKLVEPVVEPSVELVEPVVEPSVELVEQHVEL